MKVFVISLFLAAIAFDVAFSACEVQLDVLDCTELTDDDFPLDFSQKFKVISVRNSKVTKIPAKAFGSAKANIFEISDNPALEEIEANFFGSDSVVVREILIINNNNLKSFPWNNLAALVGLEKFYLISSAVPALTSYIPWPASIAEIDLTDNPNISVIPGFAFQKAKHLKSLNLRNLNPALLIQNDGLYTSSAEEPFLSFTSSDELNESEMVLEKDIFGFLQEGESWGKLDARFPDFPESAFRLTLKDLFDQGRSEFLSSSSGQTKVKNCDCSIAWLYKDAHKYGLSQYISLIGANNVICEGIGPVLETKDETFLKTMDSCPHTELPYPEQNPCDGSDTLVPNPADCSCYFNCNHLGQNMGETCCPGNLVFDPSLLTCNHPENVPSCDLQR